MAICSKTVYWVTVGAILVAGIALAGLGGYKFHTDTTYLNEWKEFFGAPLYKAKYNEVKVWGTAGGVLLIVVGLVILGVAPFLCMSSEGDESDSESDESSSGDEEQAGLVAPAANATSEPAQNAAAAPGSGQPKSGNQPGSGTQPRSGATGQ